MFINTTNVNNNDIMSNALIYLFLFVFGMLTESFIYVLYDILELSCPSSYSPSNFCLDISETCSKFSKYYLYCDFVYF